MDVTTLELRINAGQAIRESQALATTLDTVGEKGEQAGKRLADGISSAAQPIAREAVGMKELAQSVEVVRQVKDQSRRMIQAHARALEMEEARVRGLVLAQTEAIEVDKRMSSSLNGVAGAMKRMQEAAERAADQRLVEQLREAEHQAGRTARGVDAITQSMKRMREAAAQGQANAMASMIKSQDPFQAQGLNAVGAQGLNAVAKGASNAHGNLGLLRKELVTVTRNLLGLEPIVAQVGSLLGGMAFKPTTMIGILAGVAGLAMAYEHLTESARKAAEEQKRVKQVGDDFLKNLHRPAGDIGVAAQQAQEKADKLKRDIQQREEERAKLVAGGGGMFAGGGIDRDLAKLRREYGEAANEAKVLGDETKRLTEQSKLSAGTAALNVERQRALNAAYNQSSQELQRINADYDLREKRLENQARYTGAELVLMNRLAEEYANAAAEARRLADVQRRADAAANNAATNNEMLRAARSAAELARAEDAVALAQLSTVYTAEQAQQALDRLRITKDAEAKRAAARLQLDQETRRASAEDVKAATERYNATVAAIDAVERLQQATAAGSAETRRTIRDQNDLAAALQKTRDAAAAQAATMQELIEKARADAVERQAKAWKTASDAAGVMVETIGLVDSRAQSVAGSVTRAVEGFIQLRRAQQLKSDNDVTSDKSNSSLGFLETVGYIAPVVSVVSSFANALGEARRAVDAFHERMRALEQSITDYADVSPDPITAEHKRAQKLRQAAYDTLSEHGAPTGVYLEAYRQINEAEAERIRILQKEREEIGRKAAEDLGVRSLRASGLYGQAATEAQRIADRRERFDYEKRFGRDSAEYQSLVGVQGAEAEARARDEAERAKARQDEIGLRMGAATGVGGRQLDELRAIMAAEAELNQLRREGVSPEVIAQYQQVHEEEKKKRAEEFAQSQADIQQNAEVRRLRATGRGDEAERLSLQMQHEKELRDLQKQGFDEATIAAVAFAQAAEDAALAAQQAQNAMNRMLGDIDNDVSFLGLSGQQAIDYKRKVMFGGMTDEEIRGLYKAFDPNNPLSETDRQQNENVIKFFEFLGRYGSTDGVGMSGTDSYSEKTIASVTSISASQAATIDSRIADTNRFASLHLDKLTLIEEHTRRMALFGGSPSPIAFAPNGGPVNATFYVYLNGDLAGDFIAAINSPQLQSVLDRAGGQNLNRTRMAGGQTRT